MPEILYFLDQCGGEDQFAAINMATSEVLKRSTRAALDLAVAAYWVEYPESE